MGKLELPTPSVLMFCPDFASNMTPREGGGHGETKEDGDERYQGGQGKAGSKKDVCSGRWQWLDLDYSGLCQGREGPESGRWRTTSASSLRVPSAFRALLCPAPRRPSRGAEAQAALLSLGPPRRPPPRPTGLLTFRTGGSDRPEEPWVRGPGWGRSSPSPR